MTTHVRAETQPRDKGASNLIEVSGLKVHFPGAREGVFRRRGGVVRAVDGVDLVVHHGETLGLVGESGCGKSTTARAIVQLLRPTAGSVKFDGVELTTLEREPMRRMRRRMQMVFQDPYASLNPKMTVGEIVAEPLTVHDLARGHEKAAQVAELLRVVGLSPAFASRYVHEFSGGQRQRIGLARALAMRPQFIVADEPISALDVSIQAQIVNLLERLQAAFQLTYLFVAHDLAIVRHISDRIAVMYLGRIVEVADRRALYEHALHPYTQALLSAVPIPDPVVEERRRRIILTGDVPSPSNPPPGCRFHTRCWLRTRLGNPEICETVEPQLAEHATGHHAACHFPDESRRPQPAVGSSGHGAPVAARPPLPTVATVPPPSTDAPAAPA
jgi:oligopeptide transport system ATP-binding protein